MTTQISPRNKTKKLFKIFKITFFFYLCKCKCESGGWEYKTTQDFPKNKNGGQVKECFSESGLGSWSYTLTGLT